MEFRNVAKTYGIWYAQIVHSLVLKVGILQYLPQKFPIFCQSWISQPHEFCVCNIHKLQKIDTRNICSRTGKTRNLKILFEWGPCLNQGCNVSDFSLISMNFTSKYLKMFFEISPL